MERHIAFDLLHELVNVAVEHRDRTKAREQLQRLRRILRAPAPFGRDGPQGDMREDDDRRRCALSLQIVGEPGELLGAEIAHAAGLQIEDIDEADEMRAAVIEGIPALALGELAVAIEIGLAVVLVDDVVFARNVMHVELGARDPLLGVVEFLAAWRDA